MVNFWGISIRNRQKKRKESARRAQQENCLGTDPARFPSLPVELPTVVTPADQIEALEDVEEWL